MQRARPDLGREIRRSLPEGLLRGITAAIVAFPITFLVMLVEDNFTGEPWGRAVGFVLYNAHHVPIVGSARSPTGPENYLQTTTPLEIPVVVYYLVPIFLLVGAGYLVVASTDLPDGPTVHAAAGATIAAGYLPLVVVGRFFFSSPVKSYEGTVLWYDQPDLVAAILLAGLLYPIFFGAIGGLLRAWRTDSETPAETPSRG